MERFIDRFTRLVDAKPAPGRGGFKLRALGRQNSSDSPNCNCWGFFLAARLKEFRKQPTLPPGQNGTDEEDMISIARSVHRKRGSWWQVPKDLPDAADDE